MSLTPNLLYKLLHDSYGDQEWWPVDEKYHKSNKSDPRFEIIVGAILTQNTAWNNVEKALSNLKTERYLIIKKIVNMDLEKLKKMIRPSGFFNQKAERLRGISNYMEKKYENDLNKFFNQDTLKIRNELLSINGIGPETADSILLYAGELPVFVVDAYTKKICERLPITTNGITYDDIQRCFQEDLQKNYSRKEIVSVYKELHALIVELAKTCCKKRPICNKCPLIDYCNFKEKLF